MMSLNKKLFVTVCAMLTALTVSCNGPMQAGSETTSGVKIAVLETTVSVETTPAATVMLFDASYAYDDSQKIADTLGADPNGRAVFTNLQAGKYNVFVYPATPSVGASVLNIPVAPGSGQVYTDSADFDSLHTVTGTVIWQGRADSMSQAYIVGSPFSTKTDSQGTFAFTKVPVGKYTVAGRLLSRWNGQLEDSVDVELYPNMNAVVNVTLELQ
jgi:hypothetical protein